MGDSITTSNETPARRLIDTKLAADGHPSLHDLVVFLRGDDRSWNYIANRVRQLSGETVTSQTLRVWFSEATS